MTKIGDKKVGDIVKVVDEQASDGAEYIVIHKGSPSTLYGLNSDGIWLMRKDAVSLNVYGRAGNEFTDTALYRYLNITFYNAGGIAGVANQIRIPYFKGFGDTGSVQSGDKGLAVKVFVLSPTELGYTSSSDLNFTAMGTLLDYFKTGSKICNYNGNAFSWWLRAPDETNSTHAFYVNGNGGLTTALCTTICGVRPVIVVRKTLQVSDSNILLPNSSPVITSNKTGNLGTLTNGFTCSYSVDDNDANDTLNVTLKLDNSVISSFTGVRKKKETYTLGGEAWLKLANGQHTFTITVNDGYDTVESTASFTRNCKKLSISLSQPLNTDSLSTAVNLKILGNIPSDAVVKYEACNNANDNSPAWEDITQRVKSGLTHVFKNKTAVNSPAVNFRITAARGSSNTGGFIEKIVCGYE